jgi:predicted CoA-binding protein
MRVALPDSAKFTADPITAILKTYKTIAVVGLSSNPMRPSFGVTEYMQSAGYRIIPVNPNESEVLGEKSYARLEDVPGKIEIVDIFRRQEEVAAVVDSAIRVGAKVVWMQLGVENETAAEKARAAGLVVVEDACILVEHKRRLHSF